MGGIKNKLSKKLSNKTIPLSDYRLTSPFSQRGTKSSLPLAKGRQMSVAHRWGRITKYTSLACLTLAILSTLVLNIISSYSNSSTRSNAEPVSNSSTSTLANNNDSSTCDPNNTNAESCISMSISSHSATGDTNDGNLSLSIPQGGGLVAGRHTVKVVTNSVGGASLDLYTTDLANLTSVDNQDSIISSATNGNNYYDTTWPLQNSTWGVAMPSSNYANQMGRYNNADIYEQYVTNPGPIKDTGTYAGISPKFAGIIKVDQDSQDNQIDTMIEQWSSAGAYMQNIYYGAMLDNPASFPAGDYSTSVVYTATVKLPSKPTITSIDPSQYELGSGADSTVTIAGTNLASTYKVYIESNTDSTKQYDITSTITNLTDTELTVTIPTDQTNPDLEAGDYTIHVVTQGGEGTIGFTYNESKTNSVAVNYGDGIGHVQVDYDKNMIPVYYNGSQWMSLRDSMIESNPSIWFDYTGNSTNGDGSHWANAVTVKKETLSKYQNKNLPIDESDVLGYWVYIPRYSYRVMRRDVTDKVVTDEEAIGMGGFSIRFETNEDFKRTPKACINSSSSRYYQDCVDSTYPTEERLANQTAWATHPAFTWQYTQDINGFDKTYELNGFWIGKFETTGTRTAPTVKPNQHANVYEYIGEFYSAAKSIGQPDSANQYGGASTDDTTNGLTPNSHHLAKATSHMLKNSEWGAVAYLSASRYGAGVNNVQINSAYLASGSTDADGDPSPYGATGCGPESNGVEGRYDAGTLNKTTIESPTACGSVDRAYNGTIGQYASTTGNVYGVYDMSGGAWEYVMGSYSTNLSQSSGSTGSMKTAVKPPYVDIYNITSNNSCTWNTNGSGCGGHALFETAGWGGDYSHFVSSSNPWFERGGVAGNGSGAGVFASGRTYGSTGSNFGFRVALLPLPQG